jgi:hypothetical protein
MLIDQIHRLASERAVACATISLNTHRTHPANQQDAIVLKNLSKNLEERLLAEYEKRDVLPMLNQLKDLHERIDVNKNLDSLHVFLSNNLLEVVRSPFRTPEDRAYLDDTFAVRPLIRAYTRTQSYLIMVLGQSGIQLFEAENDAIQEEIKDHGFPFAENQIYTTDSAKRSDSKKMDDMVREYFNRMDKGLVQVCHDSGLRCVVISTRDNFDRLMQVADRPDLYLGHVNIDYNHTAPHKLAADAWSFMQGELKKGRAADIQEVQKAVSQSKVLTDLASIYRAVREGRGDLLVIHEDYAQPVMMTGEGTFDIVDDPTTPGAIDDIVSEIAWETMLKKGRVVFTRIDDLANLGQIALKTRW